MQRNAYLFVEELFAHAVTEPVSFQICHILHAACTVYNTGNNEPQVSGDLRTPPDKVVHVLF